VAMRSFLKKPFDLVELEAALSSARLKAKVVSSVDLEEKRELGFEGMFGSPPKQGTLRG
jgi:hypothetical protein